MLFGKKDLNTRVGESGLCETTGIGEWRIGESGIGESGNTLNLIFSIFTTKKKSAKLV